MENVIQFLKKSFAFILFSICVFLIIFLYVKGEESEKKNEALNDDIKRSEQMTQIYLDRNNQLIPKIDSLVTENSKLLNQMNEISKKDKNVITKNNEKIKIINKFWVSDMQLYFYKEFGTVQNNSGK